MDFTSPAFIADPYPVYSQLRQAGPLHSLMPGLWLATRYRVADAILRDARFGKDYLSGVARRYGPERSQNPVFATVNRFLLLMNPPEHTRLRALVSKAFGVKQAAELRRLTETAADRLIGDFYRDGRADLAAAFAYPLPMAVICALMGIRADDAQLFQQESQALVKVFELTPLNDADLKAAESAASTSRLISATSSPPAVAAPAMDWYPSCSRRKKARTASPKRKSSPIPRYCSCRP